ncbi:hypothetical protein BMF94_3257 [Rhodotorula taiwanensis]|uniref:Large ribosomal subunit protein mL40 n=1 Tax=Rhodotorula taiwanensis TaxID=741276 RepID=A0A2S5BAC9_9BASI|nr:hypothetical protein BMF94_3257 [Rhodotorula taiwanensis]
MFRSGSSVLFTSARCAVPSTPAAGARSYASKPAQNSGSRLKAAQQASRGRKTVDMTGDGRVQVIKETLYESNPPEEDRIAALEKVIPSAEAHETILRAWQLHRRHKREAHSAEIARKYNAMRSAIDFLEETDRALWEKAVAGKKYQNVDQSGATNARLEGLVPREMRFPTELPAGKMWDYDWKAPQTQQETAPKRPQA